MKHKISFVPVDETGKPERQADGQVNWRHGYCLISALMILEDSAPYQHGGIIRIYDVANDEPVFIKSEHCADTLQKCIDYRG